MSLTPQFQIAIEQGADFDHTFQWLSGGLKMAPIELITEGYPTIITVTGHEINTLSPQPIFLSGIEGCPHLNSEDVAVASAIRIDANQFSVGLTSVGDEWIPGTGEITYHKPKDITDYTARATIRKNWFTEAIIHEMTTENGGIILTPEDAGIQLHISAADTALLTFRNAVYDVDLITPGGHVTRVFKGPVLMHRDV